MTAVISGNAITALATNCEALEDHQYFELTWANYTGKLEQLVIGNSAEIPSPTNARSFKDTFQIHDSYIFICNDSHRGSYCRHSSTLLLPAPSLPLLPCLPVSPVLPLLHRLTFTLKIWLLRPPPLWCGDFFFWTHTILLLLFLIPYSMSTKQNMLFVQIMNCKLQMKTNKAEWDTWGIWI